MTSLYWRMLIEGNVSKHNVKNIHFTTWISEHLTISQHSSWTKLILNKYWFRTQTRNILTLPHHCLQKKQRYYTLSQSKRCCLMKDLPMIHNNPYNLKIWALRFSTRNMYCLQFIHKSLFLWKCDRGIVIYGVMMNEKLLHQFLHGN